LVDVEVVVAAAGVVVVVAAVVAAEAAVAAVVLVVLEEVVMVVLQASASAAAVVVVVMDGVGGGEGDYTKDGGGVHVLVQVAVVAAQGAHVPCEDTATFFKLPRRPGVGRRDVQLNDSVNSCSARANPATTDIRRQAD
jgi:hypothetical protein